MGTLRLLLAVAVILTHLSLDRKYMIDAGDAVKVFFMISGFYMAMILTEKYGCTKVGLRKFAVNRFLRLYPPYIVVFGLTLGWFALGMWMTHGQLPPPPLVKFTHQFPAWQALLFWLPNFTLVGIDFPSLFHWSEQTGYLFLRNLPVERDSQIIWLGYNAWVTQAWSIGAEICFYTVSPLIVFGSIVRPIVVLFASATLGLMLTLWVHAQVYFFWPVQIKFFALGILLYKSYVKFNVPSLVPKSVLLKRALFVTPFLWVFILPALGSPLPEFVLFAIAAISIPVLFAVSKDSFLDREIGNLSYGTYLNHMLILTIFVVITKRFHLSDHFVPIIVIVTSILMAFVTERVIEAPIERIRVRIAGKEKTFLQPSR